jgi:hypothetical protein
MEQLNSHSTIDMFLLYLVKKVHSEINKVEET